MRAALACVVMIVLSGASSLEAQGAPALREGTRVWVTTADGREQEGSVASMSPDTLVLRIEAASRSIPLQDVRRIEGRDPLWNGMRNGGIAGALALGGFGLYLSTALCEVPDGCLRNDIGPLLKIAGLGAGIGIASGALIDYAIKGRRLLYSAPASSTAFHVLPHMTAHSVGASVSVTWRR
jgi:hypothetical protein